MRVVVAPDKFAGTLTAVEAAEAIAAGWRAALAGRRARAVPMSDGGPGFVDVLHAALGGELPAVTVSGPTATRCRPRCSSSARRRTSRARRRCGLHLHRSERVSPSGARPWARRGPPRRASSPVPPGSWSGSAARPPTTAGAGLLAALGATARAGSLDAAPPGWPTWTTVDLSAGRERMRRRRAGAASDVDNPLPGIIGATKIYGPQKGLPEERLVTVDAWLQSFAGADRPQGRDPRRAPAPRAASASRCCCSAGTRRAGRRAGRRRGRPGRARAVARRTSWSPGRAPSTSPRAPARCRTASPQVAATPLRAVRRAGRTGARRLPRDAGARRGVGVLLGRPGGGGAGVRRRRRRRWPTSPSGLPGPGRTDGRAP